MLKVPKMTKMARKAMSKYGILTIKSDPPGAMITIDDVIKATPTTLELRGRALPYKVTIEKVGYDDYIKNVVVQAGTNMEIDIKLIKTGAPDDRDMRN